MNRNFMRGFGLVELMISVLLGLMISGALIQAYIASKTSYHVQDAVSEIQETGRFALNQITQDVRMAGQAGCFSLDGLAALAGVTKTANYNTVVKAATGVNTGVVSYTAATIIGGQDNVTTYPGVTIKNLSDVLTIGRVSATGLRLTAPYDNSSLANAKADLVVENIGSQNFAAGDTLLISDCHQAALFRASSITVNGSSMSIGHNAAANSKTYNTQDILSIDSTPYPTSNNKNLAPIFKPAAVVVPTATMPAKVYGGAQVMAFQQITYFIADTGRKTSKNKSSYALYERSLSSGGGAAQTAELVAGVEDMQIEYGINTGGVTEVTQYFNATHVPDFSKVASVRISLLVRSTMDNGITPASNISGQLKFPAVFTASETTQSPVDNTDGRLSQIFFTVASIRARTGV